MFVMSSSPAQCHLRRFGLSRSIRRGGRTGETGKSETLVDVQRIASFTVLWSLVLDSIIVERSIGLQWWIAMLDWRQERSNFRPGEWLNLMVTEPYYISHFLAFFSYFVIRSSANHILFYNITHLLLCRVIILIFPVWYNYLWAFFFSGLYG